MNSEQLRAFPLWSAAINYAVLLLSFGAWTMATMPSTGCMHAGSRSNAPNAMAPPISCLFGMYKLAIWLLFLAPWMALHIVADAGG